MTKPFPKSKTREYQREKAREYYRKNRERLKEYQKQRYREKHGLLPSHITLTDKETVQMLEDWNEKLTQRLNDDIPEYMKILLRHQIELNGETIQEQNKEDNRTTGI